MRDGIRRWGCCFHGAGVTCTFCAKELAVRR